MKVLFLDIDGVLNCRKYLLAIHGRGIKMRDQINPEAVKILNSITDATGANIVISSSLRISWEDNFEGLKQHLQSHGITGNIIGVTPILARARGYEIAEWLHEYEGCVDSFVILDDDSDMEHLIDHLIKTKYEDGLQEKHAQECIARLGMKNA